MSADPLELIARARAGQPEALGELCALYRNYLRIVVNANLGAKLRERVELSDVVQEALVEVVRQFPRFDGHTEAALLAWLRRLVSERLADLGRYNSRVKRGGGVSPVALDAAWSVGGIDETGAAPDVRMLDLLSVSQSSPSEVASRRELSLLVADALQDLPGAEAQVLLLHHAEGESFEAIGTRLGLSRKVVRRIWASGLKSLKRRVGSR